MGKTLYITDKDALDVDRVIVSSTGMEYKLLYSCDEIDNYENRLKADMVAMLDEIKDEIEDRLYEISDGSTYLDVEREFVRDEIFKIIDGYKESEEEDGNVD